MKIQYLPRRYDDVERHMLAEKRKNGAKVENVLCSI
jgi:hypothetical protein